MRATGCCSAQPFLMASWATSGGSAACRLPSGMGWMWANSRPIINASCGPVGSSSRSHKARAPGTEMALGRSSTPARAKTLCGQLLHHLGLWVLLQLGVWVGRCGSGARPAPLRQDAFVHLLSTPSCDSVVGHTNTLRKLGSTPHRFLPPLLRERVAANMAGQD